MIISEDKTILPKMVYSNQKYYYLDVDGSVSDAFLQGTVYAGGFALVRNDPAKMSYRWRDMLGRISVNKTQSGKDFYSFWKGELSFEDLSPLYFVDEKFYRIVKMIMVERARANAKEMIQLCNEKRELGLQMTAEQEAQNS